MELDFDYVKCDLCEKDDTTLLFTKEGHLTNAEFNIVKCKKCGLIYVNPRLSKVSIKSLYSEEYFAGRGFDTSLDYLHAFETSSASIKSNPEEILGTIASIREHKVGNRFLDVGCGLSDLSKRAEEWGYEVCGLDISPYACNLMVKSGLQVYCGEVWDEVFLRDNKNSFDVITAIEILEHHYEPKRCMSAIYQLLREGGIFFYTTGNADRIRFEGSKWGYLLPEGHINLFTPRIMRRYLSEIGFRTIDPYKFYRPGVNHPLAHVLRKFKLLGDKGKPSRLPEILLYSHLLRLFDQTRARSWMPIGLKAGKNKEG